MGQDHPANGFAATRFPRRIAVGSRHPAKVQAVESVVRAVFSDVEVVAVSVASGVSASPMSMDEAVQGAITRARRALEELDADMAVGIEDGIEETSHGTFLGGWAAVVDRTGRVGLGGGLRIALDRQIIQEVERGKELGRVVDEILGTAEALEAAVGEAAGESIVWGTIGRLTRGLVTRLDAHRQAVAAALVPFLPPSDPV